MTNDPNMQHMTLTEYVSVAILTEYSSMPSVIEAIDKGKINPSDVVRNSFKWAELWMQVREERKT
jgi:hypothetical protein